MFKKLLLFPLTIACSLCGCARGNEINENMKEKNNKPIFHITGEKGWINDPNGVIKFQGKYHVFYQHHPYSNEWGPMHWGHVVSTDLLNWEYLPFALTPGDDFDKNGCFSGSSIVVGNRLYVVYTGYIANEVEENVIQQQCLAYSDDGVNFTKLGLIIGKDKLPEGFASNDFRDPKIFRRADTFYLLVAARKLDAKGRILLYKSIDLLNWEFVSDALEEGSTGKMIECPDFIEDLGLLTYCEQDQTVDGYAHLNINSTYYRHGELKDNKFISDSYGTVDYGFDFYAPQTIAGENILVGWMEMWGRTYPSAKYGFVGQLTVPRYVSVENGKMLQKPVIFGKLSEKTVLFDSYSTRLSVGTLMLEVEDLSALSLELRKGKDKVTKFYLDGNDLVFDRSKSGEVISGLEKDELSLKGIRKMPYMRKDKDEIYIVLDKYSVEIFVNGISMSNVIYPKEESDGLEIKLSAKKAELTLFK